jgi:hypothetical protein
MIVSSRVWKQPQAQHFWAATASRICTTASANAIFTTFSETGLIVTHALEFSLQPAPLEKILSHGHGLP